MLKIHHLFFIKFITLFVSTLILAALLSYVTLKESMLQKSQEELIKALALTEQLLQKSDDFDALAKTIRQKSGYRITLVDADGAVVAESDYDKKEMENHARREELLKARKNAIGVALRHSHTLNKDFLYVARYITLHNGRYALRLSINIDSVFQSFDAFWMRIIIAIGFFILLAVFITYQMSKKIGYDIEQIRTYLIELENKNYKAVLQPRYFKEFLEISIMLKNLAKKLHNRAKQKRKHTAKLRLINKQRNDILSAISHEFKNPLAAIDGYAQTLYDDIDAPKNIRTKFLGKILANSKKIASMLDRLALSVKLENNDIKPDKSRFSFDTLIDEVADALEQKHRERKIRRKLQHIHIYADKTMMELLIANLLDNALKYSQEDIAVTLDAKRLCVIDRGIGIDEEEVKKITAKFYRVRKNSWDNSMGLGLSIVEYILKLHDTQLQIDSKPKKGSKFGFKLDKLRDVSSR